MPSSYTTSLRLEKMLTGEKTNTWGDIANTNFGDLMESAVVGVASVTHDDSANYSLTAVNGTDDEARHAVLEVGGTLTVARNLVCPTAEKIYLVKNATSGGFALTIKTTGGTGISIPNGVSRLVYCDGTNVVDGITDLPSSTTIGGTTLHTASSVDTLTNKTIAYGSNTISGTTAEFNTANTDGDFATIAGSETLTNKTLTTPVIATISNTGSLTLPTSTDTLVGRDTTDTLTNKTLTTPVISTISNTGSLTLPTSTDTLVGRDTTDTLTNKTLTTPVIASVSNGGTVTIPSGADTLVARTSTDTLTNKTVNLTSNTLSGTTAQFNTALSDGDFATLAGSETLTNKTLTAPTLTAPTITGTSIVPTESPGDNSTKIASTAYADAAVAAGSTFNSIMTLHYETASGVTGGASTTGSYETQPFNVIIKNSISGAGLTANEITGLPAGDYRCSGSIASSADDGIILRAYNVTDAAEIDIIGGTVHTSASENAFVPFTFEFTIAGTKTIRIERQCSTSRTNGFGHPHSLGTNVHGHLNLWKVA